MKCTVVDIGHGTFGWYIGFYDYGRSTSDRRTNGKAKLSSPCKYVCSAMTRCIGLDVE